VASADAIDYLPRTRGVARTAFSPGDAGERLKWGSKSARKATRRGAWGTKNHPYRHGCVLRIGRTARQSGAAREAGRGRRIPDTRGRRGRELRSAHIRRAFGDAVGHRQAKMPGLDLRKAAVRRLQGDLSADPRGLRRIHADRRAIVARRSVSRCHRKPQRDRLGDKDREEIRARIRAEAELTASAGVSYNKFLAELASDHRKFSVITPQMGRSSSRLCRSGATRCSNLSFLSRKAFGSSVSHYLHSWRRRLGVSANST
jgi:hypothetical protein